MSDKKSVMAILDSMPTVDTTPAIDDKEKQDNVEVIYREVQDAKKASDGVDEDKAALEKAGWKFTVDEESGKATAVNGEETESADTIEALVKKLSGSKDASMEDSLDISFDGDELALDMEVMLGDEAVENGKYSYVVEDGTEEFLVENGKVVAIGVEAVEDKMKKVVREGKIIKKVVKKKPARMSPAQKQALKKARMKANTGSAKAKRKKSMKVAERVNNSAEELELSFEGDNLEAGAKVMLGEEVATDGTYSHELEDGTEQRFVVADGIVASIADDSSEETTFDAEQISAELYAGVVSHITDSFNLEASHVEFLEQELADGVLKAEVQDNTLKVTVPVWIKDSDNNIELSDSDTVDMEFELDGEFAQGDLVDKMLNSEEGILNRVIV